MVTARKEILNVLSFYNPMGFLTLFQEDKEDKSFEEFKERNKMKYKSVMFLIMSIVLIGSAVGFYEYVNDDGTYYVVEKANLDESLFSNYANIIEGVLTASEGYIAEWTIAPNTIHKFTSPTYTGLSSIGDTRFFAGATSLTATGSAPFNVKLTGDISGSQVLFTGGKIAGWTISGDDLTATNMALRAGDAIEMGSATDLNTGDGVWIGNSGYFRAGDADGQRVEFNGTNLILSSSNFFLGGAGQYVSGSNGLLEISSSGFYLDNAGNTTMQGTITATAGNIGGFGISSDAIYSDNFFLSGSATGNDGTDNTNLFISSSLAFNSTS